MPTTVSVIVRCDILDSRYHFVFVSFLWKCAQVFWLLYLTTKRVTRTHLIILATTKTTAFVFHGSTNLASTKTIAFVTGLRYRKRLGTGKMSLRCVNCSLRLDRIRRHRLSQESDHILEKVKRWVYPRDVSTSIILTSKGILFNQLDNEMALVTYFLFCEMVIGCWTIESFFGG